MPDRNSFALLIDSDNVSARYIQGIMNELTSRHGQVTYRRIYGDWTSPQMAKWKDVLAEYSLSPMQQFANTHGKNATDSFLIIDAMDILYEGKVQGFCIVSSDSDFTRLASRLRDAGMVVVGMGEQKTPRSFRSACSVFTQLEFLVEDDAEKDEGDEAAEPAPMENAPTKRDIALAIADIVRENAGRGAKTQLSELGNRLVGIYPDFDVRSFGYSQLSRFLESFDNLRLDRQADAIFVSLLGSRGAIDAFVGDLVRRAGGGGMELSQVGDAVHEEFPDFSFKDLGFSKLSKYVRSIPGIVTEDDGHTVWVRPEVE